MLLLYLNFAAVLVYLALDQPWSIALSFYEIHMLVLYHPEKYWGKVVFKKVICRLQYFPYHNL